MSARSDRDQTKGSKFDSRAALGCGVLYGALFVFALIGSCVQAARAGDPTAIAVLIVTILIVVGIVMGVVALFRWDRLSWLKRLILRLYRRRKNGARVGTNSQEGSAGIRVENLNVYNAANVNLGTMRGRIISHISGIQGRNTADFTQKVEHFAGEVAKAEQIAESDRRAILERVDFLAENAATEQSTQRRSMLKESLDRIASMVTGIAPLVKIWSELEPMFRSHFGL